MDMFMPLIRGRFSPIRLLLLMFSIELMKQEKEDEMRWRIVLFPNRGVEMKQLIKTGKMFFDTTGKGYDVEQLLLAWSNGNIDGWSAHEYFNVEGLTLEEVKTVREKCRSNRHYKIIYDEHLDWQKETEATAKRKLRTQAADKAVAKRLAANEHLLDDQNKDGLLKEIYPELDEFKRKELDA
jgi:hypothetical protein